MPLSPCPPSRCPSPVTPLQPHVYSFAFPLYVHWLRLVQEYRVEVRGLRRGARVKHSRYRQMRKVHHALRRTVQDRDVFPDFPGKRVRGARWGFFAYPLMLGALDGLVMGAGHGCERATCCLCQHRVALYVCAYMLVVQWLRRFVSRVEDDDRHRSLNAYFRLVCCMYREELLTCDLFRQFVQAEK